MDKPSITMTPVIYMLLQYRSMDKAPITITPVILSQMSTPSYQWLISIIEMEKTSFLFTPLHIYYSGSPKAVNELGYFKVRKSANQVTQTSSSEFSRSV